jgi:heat shock protein HslJ
LAAIGLFSIAAAFLGIATFARGGEPAAPLGPPYESTKVLVGGEPKRLFDETPIRVDFDRDSVSFDAACNQFGGSMKTEGQRLDVADIVGTEMACPGGGRMRQDDWLVRFFASDPKWHASGRDRLKLVSGHGVIKLVR